MNLRLFLQVLKARLWIIALIFCGTVAATIFVTKNSPVRYTAATSVVVDFQNRNPFDQLGTSRNLAPTYASAYLATQVDIIRSRTVALKVVDSLPPATKVEAITAFLSSDEAKQGLNFINPTLAGDLLDNLVVRPSGSSQVLNLAFTASNARLAATIADAFAQAYIDVSLELQVEPAKRNAIWFDGQLKELRSRLEGKQASLTAYQREKGIVSIDERLDVESNRFQELSTALVEAQSNTYDVESRQLGKQHPEYRRAVERERSVRIALDRQKSKVMEIQQQRDELNLLAREVDNSRAMYDQTLQQFYQNSLQSQFTGTNVAVLSKAAVPSQPSSPDMKLNVILAVLLGLVLGFAVAFTLELLDRRVRIAEDLSEDLDVPMLVSL